MFLYVGLEGRKDSEAHCTAIASRAAPERPLSRFPTDASSQHAARLHGLFLSEVHRGRRVGGSMRSGSRRRPPHAAGSRRRLGASPGCRHPARVPPCAWRRAALLSKVLHGPGAPPWGSSSLRSREIRTCQHGRAFHDPWAFPEKRALVERLRF